MAISLSKFRKDLFNLCDSVIETGEDLILERNGVKLKVSLAKEDVGFLDRVKNHTYDQSTLRCSIDEIENLTWEKEWQPDQ